MTKVEFFQIFVANLKLDVDRCVISFFLFYLRGSKIEKGKKKRKFFGYKKEVYNKNNNENGNDNDNGNDNYTLKEGWGVVLSRRLSECKIYQSFPETHPLAPFLFENQLPNP